MPSSNVIWPNPLTRINQIFPGQMGVPGTWSETGLRQHSTGAIFYVDPNCPWATDLQDGTDPTWPMATIAAALTKCQPYRGDTVAVMANGGWIYARRTADYYPNPITETVEVTVPGVRIVGVFPSGSLGVPWKGVTTGDTILTISAMSVLVEGFCFGNFADDGVLFDGIYAEWDGATLFADNLTVRHCSFDGYIQTAIELEHSYNTDIHHNIFQQCAIAGIYSDGTPAIMDCHFHKNWFQDVAVGVGGVGAISVVNADRCKIDNNQIYNHVAEAGNAAANEGINTSGTGDYNLVHQNVLSCLLPGGGNGDYDDFNSGTNTDSWVQNYCIDGPSVRTPN